jgi:hypothetical protein
MDEKVATYPKIFSSYTTTLTEIFVEDIESAIDTSTSHTICIQNEPPRNLCVVCDVLQTSIEGIMNIAIDATSNIFCDLCTKVREHWDEVLLIRITPEPTNTWTVDIMVDKRRRSYDVKY